MVETFGQRVRAMRLARKLSVPDLALRAGLQRTHVYALEAGRKRSPRLETVRQLARALGVPAGELID